MSCLEELQDDYGLSYSEVLRLKSTYGISTDDELLDIAKKTMVLGRRLHSVESLLKCEVDKAKYHLLDFKRQDGIVSKLYDKHGNMVKFKDIQYRNVFNKSVDTLKAGELSCYKRLRLTGGSFYEVSYLLVDNVEEFKRLFACVRYDNVPYFIYLENIKDVLLQASDLLRLRTKGTRFEVNITKNNIQHSMLFQKYFSNCISSDFDVSVNNVLNFGSWLLGYLRYNKSISTDKSCILLDKNTNRAYIFIDEYRFADFLYNNYNIDIVSSKLSSEPRAVNTNLFKYWISRYNLSNFNVLVD